MTLSRWFRLMLAACAAAWIAAPALARTGMLQDVSPFQSPVDGPLDSPLLPPLPTPGVATPVVDPAECAIDPSCSLTPTAAEFKTFLPDASQPDAAAPAQSPAASPDLGAMLNYVAAGVIVVGVALKALWFLSDRRKASAGKNRNAE